MLALLIVLFMCDFLLNDVIIQRDKNAYLLFFIDFIFKLFLSVNYNININNKEAASY